MTHRPQSPPRELADLYDRSYARLVALVAVVGGSRSEAEDVVQDAFVRLLGCWPTVSSYENPEAWLRKVALGLLSNRRRKVRGGARALLRLGPPADVAGPTGDAVDLQRALRLLPLAQREVLVLVHVAGLDLATVARELDVPVGTVTSRLSRARAALAPVLREDVTDRV